MDATPVIRLDEVTKRYADGTVAVDHLSLSVQPGEVAVLIGPSGCGKTTSLKMMNRLEEPSSGRVLFEDRDVRSGDPVALRRRIGYVIQQVGLFPHLSIADNVATVPRLLGWDKPRVRARVSELLALVGLDPAVYARRWPHQLSGGQRQRVGVARALAADPPVLLMDEPFGAVDQIARNRLQEQFLQLQRQLEKTVVLVTHDLQEAIRLGDRIAVLRQGGHLEQYASPADLLGSPATPFVADFIGSDAPLYRLGTKALAVSALYQPASAPAGKPLRELRRMVPLPDWLVVLADGGRAAGWLAAEDLERDGTAGEHARPIPGAVPAGASLREALAELLRHPDGWAVVNEGERYLGVLTPQSIHQMLYRTDSS